jgi:hypothetical protein
VLDKSAIVWIISACFWRANVFSGASRAYSSAWAARTTMVQLLSSRSGTLWVGERPGDRAVFRTPSCSWMHVTSLIHRSPHALPTMLPGNKVILASEYRVMRTRFRELPLADQLSAVGEDKDAPGAHKVQLNFFDIFDLEQRIDWERPK